MRGFLNGKKKALTAFHAIRALSPGLVGKGLFCP
jgi:hypothetical protein